MNRETENLCNPFGRPAVQPVKLASELGDLSGRTLIIYDNCKMSSVYGAHTGLAEALGEELQKEHGVERIIYTGANLLLHYDEEFLRKEVERLAGLPGEGVIIGLNDAGVTHTSTHLARLLEEQKLPCVLVCTKEGKRLANSLAEVSVPGLPVVEIPSRVNDKQELHKLVNAVADGFKKRSPEGCKYNEILGTTFEEVTKGINHRSDTGIGRGVQELHFTLSKARIGDGLPAIPPEKKLVEEMLGVVDLPPDKVIWHACGPRLADVTVFTAAVNAVMAGCRPEFFPLVLGALRAMAEPRFQLSWTSVTTHPAGNAIVFSGPLAQEVGLWAGPGCLGPGFIANATIGRAVSLTIINGLRSVPGVNDLSLLGSPAEFTYCIVENEKDSPWPGLHCSYGEKSTTVTVMKVEGPHNVLDHLSRTPEGLLGTVASAAATLAANTAYMPADVLVILNPEHAWLLADQGWSKEDVQMFLFERARNNRSRLTGRGIVPNWPRWVGEEVPVVEKPQDFTVIVAGGRGPQSMVALPWGWSRAVTRVIAGSRG